jgi:hypothetical protein
MAQARRSTGWSPLPLGTVSTSLDQHPHRPDPSLPRRHVERGDATCARTVDHGCKKRAPRVTIVMSSSPTAHAKSRTRCWRKSPSRSSSSGSRALTPARCSSSVMPDRNFAIASHRRALRWTISAYAAGPTELPLRENAPRSRLNTCIQAFSPSDIRLLDTLSPWLVHHWHVLIKTVPCSSVGWIATWVVSHRSAGIGRCPVPWE